jgi:hypothetical protein
VTVRGFLVGDDYEGTDFPDEVMRNLELEFQCTNRHVGCQVCHGTNWAMAAFVWPRNGFSEFPLDFAPGVAGVVQGV